MDSFVLALVEFFVESMFAGCSMTRSSGQLVEGRHDERENLKQDLAEHWIGSRYEVGSGLFEPEVSSVG